MEEFQELNKVNNFNSEQKYDVFYVAIRTLRSSHLFFETDPYSWEDLRRFQDTLDMLEYGPIVKPHFEVFTQMLNRENATT
jgi:hypothetical protein